MSEPRGEAAAAYRSRRNLIQGIAGVIVAVALIAFALPKVTGASWHETAHAFGRVQWWQALGMFGLLLSAMWSYTFVLTGSLPGLGHVRALMMNLAGSSVSNVLPFGGAVGVAVTYAMGRSWGFSAAAIGLSAVVSGLWNVMAKLAMPALGLGALALSGQLVKERVVVAAVTGSLLTVIVLAAFVTVLASERAALAIGRAVSRAGTTLLRLLRSRRELHWDAAVIDLRHRTRELVRGGWVSMTGGMAAFVIIYAVLFWACLRVVGATPPLAEVFAAYTLGRLLTSVVVTPGGVGISETGAAALLVALGTPAAPATAGVLLFAFYVHVLEIPLGAVGWLGWTATRHRDDKGGRADADTGSEDRR